MARSLEQLATDLRTQPLSVRLGTYAGIFCLSFVIAGVYFGVPALLATHSIRFTLALCWFLAATATLYCWSKV